MSDIKEMPNLEKSVTEIVLPKSFKNIYNIIK